MRILRRLLIRLGLITPTPPASARLWNQYRDHLMSLERPRRPFGFTELEHPTLEPSTERTVRMVTRPSGYQNYRVRWEIDFDASSPEEAARLALHVMRDSESWATVFDVYGSHGQHVRIDLDQSDDPLLHTT